MSLTANVLRRRKSPAGDFQAHQIALGLLINAEVFQSLRVIFAKASSSSAIVPAISPAKPCRLITSTDAIRIPPVRAKKETKSDRP